MFMTFRNVRMVVTRRTGPALAKSAWLLFRDIISKYDLPVETNKVERVLSYADNEIYFVPLDDPEKLKSFEKINYVWAEELTELTLKDYMQLNIRCRGENLNGQNRLFGSFNPIEKPGLEWLKALTEHPTENVEIHHSTYKDNPFLEQDYIDELENLKNLDETYHLIYAKGIWAIAKNSIYNNWHTIPESGWPVDVTRIGYGLDFGYNRPTALIEIGLMGNEAYERELLYETHLTNQELIDRLKFLIPNRRRLIVADSAEPDRISEIQLAGFNCVPCDKGKDSIRLGIDRVKRYRCHIVETSVNLIDEKRIYKWKEDKEGNALDEPVDYKNHLMDAERYLLGFIKPIKPRMIVVGNMFDK